MTPAEAAQKMREIASIKDRDSEAAHAQADELLCKLLRQSGFEDLVKEFEAMTKWYA